MEIDFQTAAQVTGGLVTAAVAVAGFLTGPGTLRSNLNGDIETLTKLPSDSPAYNRLLAHIDHQIKGIEDLDKYASRDITQAVLQGILAVLLGWLGFYLFSVDTQPWGWRVWDFIWGALGVLAIICAAACLSNVFDALQKVPRGTENQDKSDSDPAEHG